MLPAALPLPGMGRAEEDDMDIWPRDSPFFIA
jgi:hypothetical protein